MYDYTYTCMSIGTSVHVCHTYVLCLYIYIHIHVYTFMYVGCELRLKEAAAQRPVTCRVWVLVSCFSVITRVIQQKTPPYIDRNKLVERQASYTYVAKLFWSLVHPGRASFIGIACRSEPH